MRFALFLVGLLFLSVGCKSADEIYNEGQTLELRGDYGEAAYHYAEALAKQPDLRKARGRLAEAGKIAVGQWLIQIDSTEIAGDPVWAAELRRSGLEPLIAAAQKADVTLALPAGYAERRRANLDAAVATLLDRGSAAAARGDFPDALEAYNQVYRYEPTQQTRDALVTAHRDVYVSWAEADLAAGRYLDAYDHAGAALRYIPAHTAASAQVIRIQTEALDLGSIRTAFAPVQPTRRARDLPRGFVGALNDALEIDYWTQPRPFLLAVESALVRRALRDLDLAGPLASGEAVRIGRAVGAGVVFAGEIERFERTTAERKRSEVETRTRTRERASYTRIEEEVTLSASVAFNLVETATGRAFCEHTVERSVQGRLARGEYGGSIRALDLDRDARRLFSADALEEAERELEDELVEALAKSVAGLTRACLLREVP